MQIFNSTCNPSPSLTVSRVSFVYFSQEPISFSVETTTKIKECMYWDRRSKEGLRAQNPLPAFRTFIHLQPSEDDRYPISKGFNIVHNTPVKLRVQELTGKHLRKESYDLPVSISEPSLFYPLSISLKPEQPTTD